MPLRIPRSRGSYQVFCSFGSSAVCDRTSKIRSESSDNGNGGSMEGTAVRIRLLAGIHRGNIDLEKTAGGNRENLC